MTRAQKRRVTAAAIGAPIALLALAYLPFALFVLGACAVAVVSAFAVAGHWYDLARTEYGKRLDAEDAARAAELAATRDRHDRDVLARNLRKLVAVCRENGTAVPLSVDVVLAQTESRDRAARIRTGRLAAIPPQSGPKAGS